MNQHHASNASAPGRRSESGEAARGGARDPASGVGPQELCSWGGGAAPVR